MNSADQFLDSCVREWLQPCCRRITNALNDAVRLRRKLDALVFRPHHHSTTITFCRHWSHGGPTRIGHLVFKPHHHTTTITFCRHWSHGGQTPHWSLGGPTPPPLNHNYVLLTLVTRCSDPTTTQPQLRSADTGHLVFRRHHHSTTITFCRPWSLGV